MGGEDVGLGKCFLDFNDSVMRGWCRGVFIMVEGWKMISFLNEFKS